MTVLSDIILSALEVVTEHKLENLLDLGRVGIGLNSDEPAGFGVHGGEPHHVGVIFAKTLDL